MTFESIDYEEPTRPMRRHKPTCQGSPAIGIGCDCGFIADAPRRPRYRPSARERRELILLVLVIVTSMVIGGVMGYFGATLNHVHASPYEVGPSLETRYE